MASERHATHVQEASTFARVNDMIIIAAWLFDSTALYMVALHINVLELVLRGLSMLWHSALGASMRKYIGHSRHHSGTPYQ